MNFLPQISMENQHHLQHPQGLILMVIDSAEGPLDLEEDQGLK